MFAVIKSGGRQYKVSVGQKLQVNRLAVEDGDQIEFGEVLLIGDADQTMIGSPFLDDAKVVATVDGPMRGKKLIVFKYKSKKRYRHRRGHRQELTSLTIDDIVANGKSLITGEAPKARTAPSVAEVEENEAAETTTTAEPSVEETPDTGTRTRRRRTEKADESSVEE